MFLRGGRLLALRCSAAAVVLVAGLSAVLAGPVAASEGPWVPPIDAPVIDPFRPPASRYGSGNRGLEYGASPGQKIWAVDDGRVVFAGRVGSARHITVDHGSGLRSTYAFVESISVVRGQSVGQGQVLGSAGPGFHLTARLGDEYVDPALLFAGYEVQLRLIEGPLPTVAGADKPWWADEWNRLVVVGSAASDLQLTNQLLEMGDVAQAWYHHDCTADGTAVALPPGVAAPSERVLIQVSGLGSSSGDASIGDLDTDALGYDSEDVVPFSYAGGCATESFGGGGKAAIEGIAATDFSAADTHQDVRVSAEHLADLIEATAAARPGEPIDIAAHSLGGVVTRLALEILAERGGPMPSVVVTIGSPHGGADIAGTAVVVEGSAIGDVADGYANGAVDALAVAQVAEAGSDSLGPPGAPPEGVVVVAIAGSTDLIVPANKAVWDGATNTVVPISESEASGAHSELPGRDEVAREIELALAGAAPRCVGLTAVIDAAIASGVVSGAQDTATVVAGASRWVS